MTEVAQGTSLARFGHGELMVMVGENAEHQEWNEQLAKELWQIITKSPCLIAVPPNDPPGWDGFLGKYDACIKSDRWYGSSFVSRHDWVPWTEEYLALLCRLWKRRCITVVAPRRFELKNTLGIFWITCPEKNAFDFIDDLEQGAINSHSSPDGLTILSCGPTGTVLADRLARKGIWAVDLGNFGKFL